VAHVDLTVVPTVLGGFWSSITGALPTIFPFCWWLVVLQDHFSRRIMGFELFRREPTSVAVYVRWFNEHRPHTYLRGRTPNEVYFGRKPANEQPRLEPRLEYPQDAWCASPPAGGSPQTSVRGRRGVRLALEVSHFEGKRHLPVVALRRAA
jgi:hypothetical protein